MARSMRVVLPVVVLLFSSVVAASTDANVSCNTAWNNLLPCLDLTPPEKNVSETCCKGLRTINELSSTPSDSKTVCNCLKPALVYMLQLPHDYPESVASYPGRCGVNLPYKLDPSTDCNR